MNLSHKNIVPVFDFGRAGSDLFIAMEYVHGRDLARALKAARRRETALSPAAIAHIGIEVCRALDYAHGKGIDGRRGPLIHRDLSPKNLLLSFAGEVVVADFGLAIPVTGPLSLAEIGGTPAYLAPEQARGDALDARADLFALGLVLREAVVGEPAYRGESPAEIIEKARRAELSPLPDTVPALLAAAIARATEVDRERRFADAREMQLALDRFVVAERAAGAEPPAHELADWLAALFPDGEIHGRALDGGDLEAVTFLDHGVAALERAVSGEGDSPSQLSVAETVGDAAEPAAMSRWRAVAGRAAALGAAAAIAMVALWLAGDRGEPLALGVPPPLDAAPLPLDAAAPPTTDAAPSEAPPPPAAAAPRRPPAAPGTVRVSWRGSWARVSVAGTGKGCPETPCSLRLPPGRYTVELHNVILDRRETRRISIGPGELVDVTID
jgi:serine/threonine-protein kinase